MISMLRGVLVEATPSSALVDVGGVGFEAGISHTTAAQLPTLGHECVLHTRLQVREDSMTLFGFAHTEERLMFDRLIAVSGVGPRLALSILSKFSPSQVYTMVMAEDDKGMSSVSGVGKKTAQRLILELKSVFEKDVSLWSVPDVEPHAAASAAPKLSTNMDDARMALLSMGFSSQEAELALEGLDDTGQRVEVLLGSALKRLGMDA